MFFPSGFVFRAASSDSVICSLMCFPFRCFFEPGAFRMVSWLSPPTIRRFFIYLKKITRKDDRLSPDMADQGKQHKGQGGQAQHDNPCGQAKGQEKEGRQPGHSGQDAGLDHVPCPEHAAEKRARVYKVRRDDIGIMVILMVHVIVPLFRSVSVPAMDNFRAEPSVNRFHGRTSAGQLSR